MNIQESDFFLLDLQLYYAEYSTLKLPYPIEIFAPPITFITLILSNAKLKRANYPGYATWEILAVPSRHYLTRLEKETKKTPFTSSSIYPFIYPFARHGCIVSPSSTDTRSRNQQRRCLRKRDNGHSHPRSFYFFLQFIFPLPFHSLSIYFPRRQSTAP